MISSAPVRHFEIIDSTNLEAARLVAAGEQGPIWLLADEQHAGRGRLGRQWVSSAGNLYATLLLPVSAPPATMPQLGFVVALAVHDTVSVHCPGKTVQLKWPNDCLLDGGKVAGILCENLSQDHGVGRVAIGCGINVAHSPQGMHYVTAHIGNATVAAVFETYRKALEKRFIQWDNGSGFPAINSDWQLRAANLNQLITITQNNIPKTGTFRGLAADGALRLEKADGTLELLYAGDVAPTIEKK